MSDLTQRPEPELMRYWRMVAVIAFIAGLIPLAGFVIVGAEYLICLFTLICWLLIFIAFMVYIPLFYKTLEFSLDNDAIRFKKGVFWHKRTTVPYAKITNIDILQGPVERIYNISRIRVQTAGYSQTQSPELVLYGIRDCDALKDTIMSRIQGQSNSVSVGSAPIPAATSADSLLQAILKEISAILNKLEEK